MPSGAPQAVFRSGSDARDDLSLACNDSGFHRLHSRVNDPGLPLRFPPAASSARSVFRLRYCLRFAPGSSGLNASNPLPILQSADSPLTQPPLPFGTFASLRIEAFCQVACEPTRLPNSPDLRSLPAAVYLSLELQAADQRSRFATSSVAKPRLQFVSDF
jgi:hypothetical protein